MSIRKKWKTVLEDDTIGCSLDIALSGRQHPHHPVKAMSAETKSKSIGREIFPGVVGSANASRRREERMRWTLRCYCWTDCRF